MLGLIVGSGGQASSGGYPNGGVGTTSGGGGRTQAFWSLVSEPLAIAGL